MAAPVGRPPGQPHSGGRRPGTPNKSAAITAKLKADLWATYVKLGQRKYLLEFAKTSPEDFMRHLMKLIPAPAPETTVNVGVGIQADSLSLTETATRIAFVLAAAAHEQGLDEPPVTQARIIEAQPELVPEPTVPTLPPSQEPDQHPDVPGNEYSGGWMEQDRIRPSRRTRTKRDLL